MLEANSNFETVTSQLSTVLEAALSAINVSEILETQTRILTSFEHFKEHSLEQINTAVDALTSIPMHPYKRLLWEHFEPDHKFKTIDDVPEPESIPINECLSFLKQKDAKIQKTIFHNLTCCPEQQFTSVYNYLSNDNVMVNYDKQRQYLEFFEMVRQIPINSVNEENCHIIAKKIIAEYVRAI